MLIVIDRHGYRDVQENELSFLDCFTTPRCHSSTTGYGDITPYTETVGAAGQRPGDHPLRVAFLIVLVGTTVETLTAVAPGPQDPALEELVRNHTVVIGYGTRGDRRRRHGGRRRPPADIVVVDTEQASLDTPAPPVW